MYKKEGKHSLRAINKCLMSGASSIDLKDRKIYMRWYVIVKASTNGNYVTWEKWYYIGLG